jgi:ribonucleotide monophosphatase NagD (HAD superfamily)
VIQGVDNETVMLGTNPDTTIPGDDGEIPGAGAFIATVEAMTGREIEVIGKPSRDAVRTVTGMKDVSPEKCLMVGDNLETDIRMGVENSMETVLVLTGVTDRKELGDSEVSPDHVIESIAELETVFR